MKSTSGAFLVLQGPHTFYPLGAVSKKQTAQSHSSPEAELVALDMAVKELGIPALDLWEVVLGRTPELFVYEDNQAAARIVTTGKSQKLRHVSRVHGISICALHDLRCRGMFSLVDCHTKAEAADIFTKHFVNPDEWKHALELIGMLNPSQLSRIG